jgi:hypothetical protein
MKVPVNNTGRGGCFLPLTYNCPMVMVAEEKASKENAEEKHVVQESLTC